MPIPEHEEISRVFLDTMDRDRWLDLVSEASDLIASHEAKLDILFHGTTEAQAISIVAGGMRPTLAFETTWDGSEIKSRGSFWGTVDVAAWWAVDAASRRGGNPALIAVRAEDLADLARLEIDIPTRDFPQYETALDDPDRAPLWATGQTRCWEDSLNDLGSVTAIHEARIQMDSATVFDRFESLKLILGARSFST